MQEKFINHEESSPDSLEALEIEGNNFEESDSEENNRVVPCNFDDPVNSLDTLDSVDADEKPAPKYLQTSAEDKPSLFTTLFVSPYSEQKDNINISQEINPSVIFKIN